MFIGLYYRWLQAFNKILCGIKPMCTPLVLIQADIIQQITLVLRQLQWLPVKQNRL